MGRFEKLPAHMTQEIGPLNAEVRFASAQRSINARQQLRVLHERRPAPGAGRQ